MSLRLVSRVSGLEFFFRVWGTGNPKTLKTNLGDGLGLVVLHPCTEIGIVVDALGPLGASAEFEPLPQVLGRECEGTPATPQPEIWPGAGS